VRIERISEDSRYLSDIVELWRRNSSTLGYFPEGAFTEHAAKRLILVAIGGQDKLLGYLLFRIVKRGRIWPKVIIVHLCVDEDHRGKGIAAALVDRLRALTKDNCLTIELSCRRDFAANDLWPGLGFKYDDERLGRAGKPIITWRMNLRTPPLLALLHQREAKSRLRAVIDANVLYRLQDPLPEKGTFAMSLSEEAKALEEAWFCDDVGLYVTDETFNEIQKNDDRVERAKRLSFAKRYRNIDTELEEVTRTEQSLQPLFPDSPSESTVSDMRQLAHAIAGDAHFFVTQDNGILRKSNEVHAAFGIKVLSPGELIGRIDEMVREAEYYPERLAGSRILTARLRSRQIAMLYSHFRCHQLGERKRQFQKRLRAFTAQPDRYEILVSWQDDDTPLSLLVFDRTHPTQLVIPMLRVSRSPLSGTVLRYLLSQAILVSAREGRVVTRVAVQYERDQLDRALGEMAFSRVDADWVKIDLDIAGSSGDLLAELMELQERFESVGLVADTIGQVLARAIQEQDRLALADVERRLWPAKVLDANIPTFVLAIEPAWAQHLFDEEIARQTLWGARLDLALRFENVYYRSSRNSRGISSPARILWYVIHDRHHPLSRHIRACSLLNEVAVGRPRPLFRRFQRLGIYEWHDVLRTAKGSTKNDIMALRFSNTELFHNPVSLEALRKILRDIEDKRPVLQSPQPISPQSFARLYTMGSR
jgi:GNAT superfamily N-acetyltransferase/predicted nucleic acid-binding protein